MEDFSGVKVALMINNKLILIKRDDKPGLLFANLWDFPGGGREKNETPIECAIRETKEELGITLTHDSFIWQKQFPSMHDPAMKAYFLVANLPKDALGSVKFGNEGQGWKLTTTNDFFAAEDVIPSLKGRMQAYLDTTQQNKYKPRPN